MNSEGLLGPLPKHFQSVFLFDEREASYYRSFRKLGTGEYQCKILDWEIFLKGG